MFKYFDKMLEFIKNNKVLIIFTIIFTIISFGFLLFIYTIGVDTEYSIFIESSPTYRWIAQGRFGIGIFKFLMATNNIHPFRNTLLSLICVIINSLLLCKMFGDIKNKKTNNKNDNKANIIFALLYTTFPIAVHYMYFTTYNFEVSFSMILTSLSIYFLNKYVIFKDAKKYLLYGIILLMLAISFYQSLIPVYIAIVLASIILFLLADLEEKKQKIKSIKILKLILNYVMALIVALVLYYILNKIIINFVPNEPYLNGFFGWEYKEINLLIEELKNYFLNIYFKGGIYGSFIVLPTIILSGLIIIVNAFKKNSYKIIIPLLIITFILTPMIMSFGLGISMPFRTQQVMLITIPFIWYLAYYFINSKILKNLFFIVVFLISLRQTMYINKLLYSNYLRYNEDVNISRKISDKIYDLNIENLENYPVVYLGKKETTEIPNNIKQELIGYSIYEWDNGNYVRIQALVTMVADKFKTVYYLKKDEDTLVKARDLSKDMPSWPNKGSIDFRGGMIIVKLSE